MKNLIYFSQNFSSISEASIVSLEKTFQMIGEQTLNNDSEGIESACKILTSLQGELYDTHS